MSFHQDEFHQRLKGWVGSIHEQNKQDALRNLSRLIENIKDDIKYETPLKNKHGQSYDGDLKYILEVAEYVYQLVYKI
jgi:hypothetical protein